MPGIKRVLVGVCTLALLCLLASSATPALAAKHAKHACKHGQARVKIGRRTTCVSESLPAHASGDQAMLAAHAALGFSFHGLRDRRGRRPRTLAPRDVKLIEGALTTGLAKANALAGARIASLSPARAASGGGCLSGKEVAQKEKEAEEAEKNPEYNEKEKHEIHEALENFRSANKSSYNSGGVNASIDLATGGVKLGLDVKDKNLHIEVDLNLCDTDSHLHLDDCPTAEGIVNGTDEVNYGVAIKVTEGQKVLFTQSFKLSGDTTVKAQTGDDGKLDYFDIKHIYKSILGAGGSSQGFGPVTIDYTYIGETRVDMRSGGNPPPHADVAVALAQAGLDPHARIQAEIALARDEQQKADENFAAEIKKFTEALRKKEEHWMTPNKCAKIKFEPASESIKLHKGQSATVKSRAEAGRGGAPASASWTVSGEQNATFTPGGSTGNPLSTSYDVTNAGKGLVVSATFKAVSKAGVAELPWKQKTAFEIKSVTGSFTGRYDREGEVFEWSGTATLAVKEIAVETEAAFTFQPESGEVKITASGVVVGANCSQTGSATLGLAPQSLWSIEVGEPFEYQVQLLLAQPGTITVTWVGCSEPANNGFKEAVPLPGQALLSGDVLEGQFTKTSSDGVSYEGNTERIGTDNEVEEWTWSFTASS